MDPISPEQVQQNYDIREKLKQKPIELIPEASKYSEEELKEMFPGKTIVVCDFPVTDISSGEQNEGGYAKNGILNIDHHADDPRMERYVSSTNLAMAFIESHGTVSDDWQCLIHHTDADSVLSSSIIRGILKPEDKFGEAAIAADHTGAENKIGDLLQALQEKRDLFFSLRQLQLLLENQPLDSEAEELLQKRYRDREKAKQIVENGEFKTVGDVSYAVLTQKVDGALISAFLPEAKVILLFSPMKDDPSKWEVKFRLGQNVPEGFSLKKLGINEKMEGEGGFGGRWNAGSNKRGGGTSIDPETYSSQIAELVASYLEANNPDV